jgi:hypothetical protein
MIGTVFRNYDVAASLAPEYTFDSGIGHHLEVIPFDTIRQRGAFIVRSQKALTTSPPTGREIRALTTSSRSSGHIVPDGWGWYVFGVKETLTGCKALVKM